MNWLVQPPAGQAECRRIRLSAFGICSDCLLTAGVFAGVQLFCHIGEQSREVLTAMQATEGIAPSFSAAVAALGGTLLFPLLLMLTAFLSGLSPCGVVTARLVPVIYGIGTGLTLARMYAGGWVGALTAALIVVPQVLCMRKAIGIGCEECCRMSRLFWAQLRPASVHCGGLQPEFRSYCLRFASSGVFVLASAVWDVSVRMICNPWLQNAFRC